jgi:hypothetical protein
MRGPIKFHWKSFHHLYIGLCVIVGTMLIVPYQPHTLWTNIFFILGIYTVVDDLIVHTVTANTPLKILFEKTLYRMMLKIDNHVKR